MPTENHSHRTAHSCEGRSNGAGEDTIHREREAVLQNKRVNDAIQTALERGELVISPNGYLATLTAPPASDAGMREALERAKETFEQICVIASGCATTHGDPGGGLEMIAGYASDGFAALAQPEAGGER